MLSVLSGLLLGVFAVGVELQGRRKWGLAPSNLRELFRALFDSKSDPSVRAKLFCLCSSLIFAIWESFIFFLFNVHSLLLSVLSLLGFFLMCLFVVVRMRVFFWNQQPGRRHSLTLISTLGFFVGFCLLVIAPFSALIFSAWIWFRWRQKSAVSQIGHNSLSN